MARLTKEIIAKLHEAGLECFLGPGTELPDDVSFEAPCSIKWMQIHYKLSIGAFSYAVKGFYFNVGIGRYTSIGEDVQVGRGDHPTDWVSTSPAFYLDKLFNIGNDFSAALAYRNYVPVLPVDSSSGTLKFTEIGHDVYIGHGAFIRPGIKIGHGAIIGAHAVVVKDVPPYAVVVGNPAVIKKYKIPEALIERFLAVQWWRFAPWQLAGINMTNPETALPALEETCPILLPYEPGVQKVQNFFERNINVPNIKPALKGTKNMQILADSLTALSTVQPPFSHMRVTHHIYFGPERLDPLFYFPVDAICGATYELSVWLYIPENYDGTPIDVLFFGQTSQIKKAPDLTIRNQWQDVLVEIILAAGRTSLAPSLTFSGSDNCAILSAGWKISKSAEPGIKHKARYQVVSLTDIMNLMLFTEDARPLIKKTPCLPDIDIAIPPVSYGQINAPDGVTQYPLDSWSLSSYQVEDAAMYILNDAIIHGEQGIITIRNMIVAESLYFAFPEFVGFEASPDEPNVYYFDESQEPDCRIDSASHALCGYVSNRNYAHWWVDAVPLIMIPPFHDAFQQTTLLMPKLRAGWQTETLSLLPEINGCSLYVGEHTRIACKSLRYIPKAQQSDFSPHPFRHKILDTVKTRAGFTETKNRRIYISRRDAAGRKLINELDIENLLAKYDFEIIMMSGRPVAEQIRIFAESSHVISPHGAGLANVMFCPPDAAICELQLYSNVQWTIRRLAAVQNLRYGCIVGFADDDTIPLANRNWRVDLDKIEMVLNDQNFIRPPRN